MDSHPEQRPDWANLAILHRNTLPPRSDFVLYNSEEDALARDISKAKVHCLSGDWRFHLANSPFEAPESFECPTFDSSEWSKIKVPGMWQMQGFGRGPHYTYPFHVDPPYPPFTDNECGSYITHFSVPEHLKDDQLRLRFEGVDSAYDVWINETKVGYSEGSRNPAEFDITAYVNRDQQNLLAVRVYQFSTGSYIEDQDQWWLSGIFRDVLLLGFPKKVHFDDVAIQTILDEDYRHATLKVQVTISDPTTVDLRLLDAGHKQIAKASQSSNAGDSGMLSFSIPINNPEKWTAETPYLYELVLSVGDDQFTAHRVGFRQVEIKDSLVKVNGKRVLFKGANRHEHHPESGRAVPYEFLKQDLLLMKAHNINAIRTCHQPNDPRLYDLADVLGFWIMDEADLECHGFETIADAALSPEQKKLPYKERQELTRAEAARWTSDNPEWHDAYVDRAKQVVQRDRLHPSIIIWSLGNEAFYGRNHTAMVDWIRSHDPTRLIHYEPDRNAEHVDMFSRMYPHIVDIVGLAENECKEKCKPVVLCEYIHAMGTGPGNIKEYMDAFYAYPQLQGGWVWEWSNHGLLTKTLDGTPYYGYGGDFGDVPNDSNFVMDGVLQSDHTPNSGLIEYKKALEPIGVLSSTAQSITIINRLDFATLDHLRCCWSVTDENGPVPDQVGEIDLPADLQPGEIGEMQLPRVDMQLAGEALLLLSFRLRSGTLWADAGHEVAWAQVNVASNPRVTPLAGPVSQPLKATRSHTRLDISGHRCQWSVNIADGTLAAWKKDGKDIITQPLKPTFYRAPTDNDAPVDGKDWKETFLHLASIQPRSCKWRVEDGDVIVELGQKFAPPVLSWSIDLAVLYTFGKNGSVRLSVKGRPTGLSLPSTLPRIGITVGLDKGFQTVEWFGRGSGESYRDMKLSQKVGRFAVQNVGALWPGQEFPQEGGNRADTRWLELCQLSGRTQGKTSLNVQFFDPEKPNERRLFDFMACNFFVKDIDEAQHPYELERKAQEAVLLRLDADHHGIGTGSCGPKTLEQYTLKMAPFDFGILMY